MKVFFASLSAIVAFCTLLISVKLCFEPRGFLNLGPALALLALGCGNLLCFVLNLAVCWLGFRRPWFICTLLIQSVFVILSMAWVIGDYVESYRGRVGARQLSAIHVAIEQDDLQAFIAAKKACDSTCQRMTWDEQELLYASQSKAYNVASWIVVRTENIYSDGPSRDRRTCEGIYLPSLNALEWAVSDDDYQMASILLPVASPTARYRALRVAAQLNRLEMLQWLVSQNIPLDSPYSIPYPSPDHGKALLIAAAESAAFETALWLINDQGVPVDHGSQQANGKNNAVSPLLWAYWRSIMETDSPDTTPFLMLMVAHGANLEVGDDGGQTLLQWAIRLKLPNIAQSLMDAGANTEYLNDSEQKALNLLLTQERGEEKYSSKNKMCVKINRPLP